MIDNKNIMEIGAQNRVRITQMLGELTIKDTTKNRLLSFYFDIILEHHESIHLLINNDLYGSAFTLVRPFHETVFRLHWVNRCASEEQVKSISKAEAFRFPMMRKMIEDIDAAYGTDNFFKEILNNSWSAMNSYTHTGLLQLSRRWKNNGIEPNYDEVETREVINSTNIWILLSAWLYFTEMQESSKVDELVILLEQYIASQEKEKFEITP